jgi:putative cell wall-binding protein
MREAVQARIDAAPPQDDLPEEEIPGEDGGEEAPAPTTYRMAGDNRYATAAAISKESFPDAGGVVFISSGESFPDALSGGPAAAGRTAPVLLSRQDSLPSETVKELQRLAPSTVYILGGTAALSARVFRQARSYSSEVVRLAGTDRYGTGVKISQATWPRADVVYVASGLGYADALSGGALAASQGAPILLSSKSSLPSSVKEELDRLSPSKVVILGGVASLTRAVRREIAATVPSATVSRVSGPDRYATSAAIVRSGWQGAEVSYFAGGANFPDALAGVPAAGTQKMPLLLTRETCLPPAVADVADMLASPSRVLLGGATVLRDEVATTRCE